MKNIKKVFFLFGLFLAFVDANSQSKPKSPAEKSVGIINGSKIEINYGSPSVRERKIWGELVPFGQLWRAGANEATTIEISKEITIEGQRLPAGKYSFFVIPNEKECVLIFNKVIKQWGTSKYSQNEDQLRVIVKPEFADSPTEKLTYSISQTKIDLKWDNWIIGFSVK